MKSQLVNLIKSRFFSAALVSLFGLTPCLSAGVDSQGSPAFSFHDDFSSATLGITSLNGARPTGAPVQWVASSNLGFRGDAGKNAVVTRDNISYVGWIPLSIGKGTNQQSGRITIEATLRPVPVAGKQNWVAVGIGETPERRNIHWAQGVFVFVSSNGLYSLLLSPTGTLDDLVKLNNGGIPNIAPGDTPIAVPVRLVYNMDKGTLSLNVNGQSVVSDCKLADYKFTPLTQVAGFSGYAQEADAPLMTDFSVTVTK